MILTKYENIKKILFMFYITKKCLYIYKKIYCLCFSFIRKIIEILYWKIVENL